MCICVGEKKHVWLLTVENWRFILVGGLEHFLFSNRLRIITPIDVHIFERDRYKYHQPVLVSAEVLERAMCHFPAGPEVSTPQP